LARRRSLRPPCVSAAALTRPETPPLPHPPIEPFQPLIPGQFNEPGSLNRICKRDPRMPEPCRLHKIAALWVSERFGKRQQRFTLRWWEFAVGQTVDLKLLHGIDGITKQLAPGLFSRHGSQRHRQPLNKRLMKVC